MAENRAQTRDEFGTFLKGLLRQRYWTQVDLARRIGVDQSQVSKWARGLRVPDTPHCTAIAEAFGISPYEVLAVAGRLPPESIQETSHPARDRVVALAQRLEPEVLELYAGLMERYIAAVESAK